MNWKKKAFIQNFVACLPKKISYELYFQIQRHFGGLKKPYSPISHFQVCANVLNKIIGYGYTINGKAFFEVGTGRVPLFPVAFWLCGAGKIITIDLNPYIRNELIMDMLFFIKREETKIKNIFGNLLDMERFDILLNYSRSSKIKIKDTFNLCKTEYISPGDAAKTDLPENSIDYHISHTVYEHIPLSVIENILTEGNRIISKDGLFINHIDYADHFAKMDKTISAINFLQYNDKEWEKYAGNRYMYMNRVRHTEFVELFKKVGHEFLEIETFKNKNVEEILEKNEIVLDDKFKNFDKEILSITGARLISKLRM